MNANDPVVKQLSSIERNTAPTIEVIPEETATRWNLHATLAQIADIGPIVARYLGADVEERDEIAEEAEGMAFDGTSSARSLAGAAVMCANQADREGTTRYASRARVAANERGRI